MNKSKLRRNVSFTAILFALALISSQVNTKELIETTKSYAAAIKIKINPAGGTHESLQLHTFDFTTPTPKPTAKPANPGVQQCGPVQGRPESIILWAAKADPPNSPTKIKAWYVDEWPLTLGSGSVSQNTADHHIVNPNVGNENAKDRDGFPYFPALFLSGGPGTTGDARHGGTPIKPNEVYGIWKALGFTDRYSGSIFSRSTSLPSGADPVPDSNNPDYAGVRGGVGFGANGNFGQNYVDEIIWNLDGLGLTHGNSYSAEVILHDGDSTGDVGDMCFTFTY